MFKAYKASDQQWIEWICKTDLKEEKKLAIGFFLLATAVFLVSIVGLAFGKYEFAPGILGALPIFLMGLAKLNNFRLYGIIQSLSNEGHQLTEGNREPVAGINSVTSLRDSTT